MSGEAMGAIQAALEASIFQSPRDPGLTAAELQEVLRKIEFKAGEIEDAITDLWRAGRTQLQQDGKYRLDSTLLQLPMVWGTPIENYPARVEAVDFPMTYLRELQREVGRDRAKISRDALVAAGMAKGNEWLDVEVAITLLEYGGILQIKSDVVELAPGTEQRPLYSEIIRNNVAPGRFPMLERVLPLVRDTVRRRDDGRLPSVEPLVAFEGVLDRIGAKEFAVWWKSLQGELSTINPTTHPKSYLLLAAGVCEGMLAIVAPLARQNDLSMVKKLDDDSRNWKLISLIEAACSGPRPIITGDPLRAGLMALNVSRQFIHAGSVVSVYKERAVTPDVKQEEARHAKEYTEKLCRRILDWLQENGLLQ